VPKAEMHDSSYLSLEDIVALIEKAIRENKKVASLLVEILLFIVLFKNK